MRAIALSELSTVYKLAEMNQSIPLSTIHPALQKDLKTFIIGRTFTIKNNDIMVFPNDFREWLHKLNTSGFDYAIQLKDEHKETIA